jgi:hypothetical protein
MKLSESAQQSLDLIRFKVEKQQYDLSTIEKNCLKEVFEEIQLVFVGKKVKLDIACSGCIKTAVNICNNFINTHEERTSTNKAKVVEVTVKESKANVTEVIVKSEPTLSELREKYPHIKSTSVKGFLQKLEDEKAI